MLAARERGRAERGVTAPQIVVAESAHAAFHKSAHLFDMRIDVTPVRDDWRADVEAMAAAVGPDTVLVVGSAPQYPQGVIDPIPEIAELAATVGANCHVDACMGGFVLPFVERLGRDVPPWDFRVDGVHSISADIHKLGYAPKGVSVILHRTKQLRAYQTFAFDGWLGGFYASPNLQGSRSGLPMAAAWAVMQHLGIEGYVERTRATLEAADRMRAGIGALDGIRTLGDGGLHLVTMAADIGAGGVDVFSLGDALRRRGLVPRPPGAARLAALDRQLLERGRHRRVARRPRRLPARGQRARPPTTGRRPMPPSSRHAAPPARSKHGDGISTLAASTSSRGYRSVVSR